jgi:hypothetical protein
MISCIPQGLCSWNYSLDGDGHRARVELNWIGEQGAITADDVRFEVRKRGVLSGHWTLDHDGEALASAEKSSAFTRTLAIRGAGDDLLLRAEYALARSFRIERSGEAIATIRPAHAFTRRATIEPLRQEWDFRLVCFAFWLVVLMWRRAASSD